MENFDQMDDSNNDNVPIRTFCIASIKLIAAHKIQEHFLKFGELDFVQWNALNKSQYGIVQFKKAESAKKALSIFHHSIGNAIVKVSAADIWHQPDFDTEKEQDSAILNILDNDCLQGIFRRLDLTDLCNVAETCIRFEQQARETFSFRFKHDQIKPFGESVLRKFGTCIESLKINHDYLLKSVSYCSSSNLKELWLSNVVVNANLLKQLCPVLRNLEVFMIDRCNFNDNFDDSLVELGKLTKLSIGGSSQIHSSFIIAIGKNMPNLIELNIERWQTILMADDFEENLTCFSNLKSLKLLKLDTGSFDGSPLLGALAAGKAPIEHLELIGGSCWRLAPNMNWIQSICEMKCLKKFILVRCAYFTENHLIQLVKELPEITKIEVRYHRLNYVQIHVDAAILQEILFHAQKLSSLELRFVKFDSIRNFNLSAYQALAKIIERRAERIGLTISITTKSPEDRYIVEKKLLENGEQFNIHISWDYDIDE